MTTDGDLRLAIVVSFLNEEEFLERTLASLAAQTAPPDELLLVDDGSSDRSYEIARRFASEHEYATALQRPARPPQKDRLVDAPELQAFLWGVQRLTSEWDIVTKMDGDIELAPSVCADVRAAFAADPQLGIAGSFLDIVEEDGTLRRERNPSYHVRGPNKFYRRPCFEAIAPLPMFLGWDTIDDLRARQRGWNTRSLVPTTGRSVHLRPTGRHGGRLRAYRRWGRCAWGYGAHPLWVGLGALRRAGDEPYLLGGVSYLIGWAIAALRRYPRAESSLRRYTRQEEMARLLGRGHRQRDPATGAGA